MAAYNERLKRVREMLEGFTRPVLQRFHLFFFQTKGVSVRVPVLRNLVSRAAARDPRVVLNLCGKDELLAYLHRDGRYALPNLGNLEHKDLVAYILRCWQVPESLSDSSRSASPEDMDSSAASAPQPPSRKRPRSDSADRVQRRLAEARAPPPVAAGSSAHPSVPRAAAATAAVSAAVSAAAAAAAAAAAGRAASALSASPGIPPSVRGSGVLPTAPSPAWADPDGGEARPSGWPGPDAASATPRQTGAGGAEGSGGAGASGRTSTASGCSDGASFAELGRLSSTSLPLLTPGLAAPGPGAAQSGPAVAHRGKMPLPPPFLERGTPPAEVVAAASTSTAALAAAASTAGPPGVAPVAGAPAPEARLSTASVAAAAAAARDAIAEAFAPTADADPGWHQGQAPPAPGSGPALARAAPSPSLSAPVRPRRRTSSTSASSAASQPFGGWIADPEADDAPAPPLCLASRPQGILTDAAEGARLAARFRKVQELGTGGFGTTYRVLERGSDREFALKEIKLNRGELHPDIRHEVEMMVGVLHPRIVRYHGSFLRAERSGDVEVSFLCVVMEIGGGGNLADLIERPSPSALPLVHALSYTRDICLALDYLHTRRRILHRDVKPENIVICNHEAVPFGVAKLVDFGLAAAARTSGLSTQAGTQAYSSPEKLTYSKYSTADDMWAVAMLLSDMVTGQLAYEFRGPRSAARGTANKPLGLDRALINHRIKEVQAVDPRIGALVRQLLDKRPAARPSAADVARFCEHALRARYRHLSRNEPQRRHELHQRAAVVGRAATAGGAVDAEVAAVHVAAAAAASAAASAASASASAGISADSSAHRQLTDESL